MSPVLPELVSYLEGLPEPHILFDRQYRIVAANAAYRSQFGGHEPVLGRCCYDVSHRFQVPCDQAGESCPLARAVESGQRERVLHLHHTPMGEEYVQIELVPLRNGEGDAGFFIERMERLRVARGQAAAHGLIGRAPVFQQMLARVARVGPSMAAVLLLGESGTGKELLAHAVHEASDRMARPLVAVDCASLPESLFESELFGHERGAFTGAIATRPGLVEAASGGTLFLDEVGDIPLQMQVKLLRLLESGTYRRVGGTDWRRADVRVVSATHRDLRRMVAEGRFREDLYYRLSVFPIRVPPLRQRAQDIPLLAESLLQRLEPRRALRLEPQAVRLLQDHPFPGNVRELRNVLERAALMTDGRVITRQEVWCALHPQADGHHAVPDVETARPGPAGAPRVPALDGSAATMAEGASPRDLLQASLRAQLSAHRGSRAQLAARLGISPRTLYRRLKDLAAEAAPAAAVDAAVAADQAGSNGST